MIRFLIYLFETGMCLTLLFLVYFLFLRNETYFTFNRIYLLSILLLSFALPLLQLKIPMPDSQNIENRVSEIKSVKNHYERLIAMTDPDYRNSFTTSFEDYSSQLFEEQGKAYFSGSDEKDNLFSAKNNSKIKTGFWADVNWARVLLTLYLLGTLFFAVRLLLLFRWLGQTVSKYGSSFEDGVKLVKMDEEVPPFSFFRFVYLHGETTSHSGFSQIMAHEKVHIAQRHSLDLMFAHLLTIVQWFNPFAWLINKAMKTNHEYIADRSVVEQGYELFDYQSLLLKQMISIRSVELVNNFNLVNIKKRIAMMTKIKSGFAAQIKALVVIPAAMFVFFFFAEITFAQNTNEVSYKLKDRTKEIQGFWKNEEQNTYGQLLNFKRNELQILESIDMYRIIPFTSKEGNYGTTKEAFKESKIFEYIKSPDDLSALITSAAGPGNDRLILFTFKNDKLIIAWSPEQVGIYKKCEAKTSLDCFSNDATKLFTPVTTAYFRISDNPVNTYLLLMNKRGELQVDGVKAGIEDLPERIKAVKSKGNPFTASEKIPMIVIDADCNMAFVDALYHKLREMNELKYILSVKPGDVKVPEVFYHAVGIPRLLPPKDAELLEENAVEKSGMKIIRADLTKAETTPATAAGLFKKEIQKDKKFVVLFSYRNNTAYKEYLSILDEFHKTIFAKRNQLAHDKYKLGYDELAAAQQQEVRKSYPMVITEKNVDQL